MPKDRRSQTSTQRTEEERERAREEREKRRLAKSGASTPPLPPPEPQAPVEPMPEPSEPLVAQPTPEPQAPVVHTSEPQALPAPMPEPSEPVVAQPRPEPQMPVVLSPEPPEPVVAQPPPESQVPSTPTSEPAVPKSPVEPRLPPYEPLPPSVLQQSRRPGRVHRPQMHRPHLHRPHLHRSVPSRGRSLRARVAVLLAFAVVLVALVAAVLLLTHHSKAPKPPPPPPPVAKVVIPEGYTRAQIAALAHADGLTGSYLVASKSSSLLRPTHYGAPSDTPNLEGFLFPASYELYAHTPASRLVSEQLAAFKENFGGGEVHRAEVLGITPYQLLIVASMIEREAELPHDRARVAAVIYNRLHANMALGIDSTLRYALKDFTHPLTEAQLHSDSPYNTRIHTGLPPTPISNPGVAAIKAAAHPAHDSYLYYVAGADGCGELVFSTSYAQFEKNAAAYNEAIARNGGRVPTCKKK